MVGSPGPICWKEPLSPSPGQFEGPRESHPMLPERGQALGTVLASVTPTPACPAAPALHGQNLKLPKDRPGVTPPFCPHASPVSHRDGTP